MRPTCPDDHAETAWHEIAGDGRVVSLTRARTRLPFTEGEADWTFVLVAMTGADNAVFGRLLGDDGSAAIGTAVRLAAPQGPLGHPAQAVQFVALE